ncbi:5,10-methylenetetrahydrofolate reductase [Winogradskyella psychrotolerans RS-3]|uniref:5,10-methylenetetrahydrofolate reductase n=1 Tax=Winogradskyella psychrotolerans RS-3 TaxID=641526 RepID=S7X1Q6_9FLAO|nr:5,10-methylenetetrahydrofolate reductase [Winogradskyella psychrotolerans RS-3]
MKVTDHIKNANGKTLFSFEIIPPKKEIAFSNSIIILSL